MKEKKKRKKKRIITLVLLLVIVITAAVTQITNGIISWAYISMKEFLWPPKLELTLNKCFIYRKDFDNFPICEFDIVAYNPSDKKITAELKKLKLFRENISYSFPRGQEILSVEAKEPITKRIFIKDKVFESALKIP